MPIIVAGNTRWECSCSLYCGQEVEHDRQTDRHAHMGWVGRGRGREGADSSEVPLQFYLSYKLINKPIDEI